MGAGQDLEVAIPVLREEGFIEQKPKSFLLYCMDKYFYHIALMSRKSSSHLCLYLYPLRKAFAIVVQAFSHARLFATPWTVACKASLSFTIYQSSLKLMSNKLVMPSYHLILCHPLLILSLVFPSIRVFSNESVLHIRWQKYWSLSFSISPSNEHSGLVSFRIDWFDLFAVQGTLKSLSNNTVQKHQFFGTLFIVQLPHPYMTTGKTIALTRWTFVGKAMSLLFHMQSMFVIAFLRRSKCILISWV